MSPEEMKEIQDIGLSRGGKNTKIHALVDGLGNPIRLIFTGGEVHDSREGIPLLEGFNLVRSVTLGDKAFGTALLLLTLGNVTITIIKNAMSLNASSIS